MSDNLSELNMIQLRHALQQAVLPADRQIAKLKGTVVAFEVADDVGNQILWVLQWPDARLTQQQRSILMALDSYLTQMSGKQNAHLWTEPALSSRPEWDVVRRQARRALDSFGWPIEEVHVPRDERALLMKALRVAALPADEQIASFPDGSPVAEWIAGDFFNWSGMLRSRKDFTPTEEQQAALSALDARLNEMSEGHVSDKNLWMEDGLRFRTEWEEVRREARKILELLQGPFDGSEVGND